MTDRIINLVAAICEQVGRIAVLSHGKINPHLRKENRIRTIHSSLAIEQNSLSLEQVTAILDGKRVLGNPNEIREVKNAYDTYELLLSLDPNSVKDLLKAHRVMMEGLILENGIFRSRGVGIFDGDVVVHMAPPAEFVPMQIRELFEWYKGSQMHPLIKSTIFHYEFELIHPFADGNGRIGRMWHSLLLGKWNELFFWLPIEELIRGRQQDYYDALGKSDKEADSYIFVELMLEIILTTLEETVVVGDSKEM
jgi:fic family protein